MTQYRIEEPAERSQNKPLQSRIPVLLAGMILSGILLVAAAAIGFLITNRAPEQAAGKSSGPVQVGMQMGDFSLPDLEGRSVHLRDYRGQWVLINAWATWCPPCRSEMPDLNSFYQQHQEKGFVILGVNAGESREQAAGFASSLGLGFPVLLDVDEKLMDALFIRDFPTSILIDRNGIVKTIHIGMMTREQMDREFLPWIE